MNSKKFQENAIEKLHLLSLFKQDLSYWYEGADSLDDSQQLRTRIRQNVNLVREIVAETYCLKLMPTNPQSNKGLVVRDCDPFDKILNTPYYGVSFIPAIVEMIDETIAVLDKR